MPVLHEFSSGTKTAPRPDQLFAVTGFIFLLSLLIVGAVLSFRAADETAQSTGWVEHTNARFQAGVCAQAIDLLYGLSGGP